MQSNLFDRYQKEIKPELQKALGLSNSMQVPKIEKICVNIGMGSYLQKFGSKDFSDVEKNMTLITGQKPVVRRARMSVSNFKLREGSPVGMSVTLRGQAAYNFLEKMIHVVYPRVRDFRGVSAKIFDKDANCSIGLNDHTVFPEVEIPEDARRVHGMQVTIVTNTKNTEHSKALLDAFGFPFRKKVTN